MNYDEESENEMIQPADLADLRPLAEDESKYRALHSHVKHYNERNTEDKRQLPNVFPYLRPYAEEAFNLEQEERPCVAGFKHELDKVSVFLSFCIFFSFFPPHTITEPTLSSLN